MNNKSINPIYLGKQSSDKVVEFICSLLHHASESNTEIARLSATQRCLIVKKFLSLCVFIGTLVLWWRLGLSSVLRLLLPSLSSHLVQSRYWPRPLSPPEYTSKFLGRNLINEATIRRRKVSRVK